MEANSKPCRPLLLLVAVLVVVLSCCCCCFCAEATAADEQSSSRKGAAGHGRRGMRRSRRQAAAVVAAPLMVPITVLKSAVDAGAVCMDGTPPAYHLDPGSGAGNNSWIVNLEGGGWCNNVRACQFRKTSRRGSSDLMEKEIPFGGIMSNSPADNPDFYNWNRVKIRYCDGASFAGEGFDKARQTFLYSLLPYHFSAENGFYFRGQRIWDATIRHLLSIGMASADQVLLTGCSAGGLAVILHCDEFQAFFPPATSGRGTTVKCLADAGLFLDTYCFFPQYVIDGIKTPIFLLNAAYDAWQQLELIDQIQESLAPNAADPSGAWRTCKSNRSACDASQMKFLQDFRDEMVATVRGFSGSRSNGLFINSCFAHCQSELPATWSNAAGGSPSIQNKGIAKSVGDWYFDRAEVKAVDCAYPCDGTCRHII
nr:unnamed protein product [Digitaria exilis]